MNAGLRLLLLLSVPWGLAGCDLLGIETLSQQQARRAAEGKAIGSACRHAGRAIEDCYTLNRKADKAAVFAGWREMNDYMTENKIEVVAPTVPTPEQLAAQAKAAEEAEAGADEAPHDDKKGDRKGDKKGGQAEAKAGGKAAHGG
jgi:hypothetical protein